MGPSLGLGISDKWSVSSTYVEPVVTPCTLSYVAKHDLNGVTAPAESSSKVSWSQMIALLFAAEKLDKAIGAVSVAELTVGAAAQSDAKNKRSPLATPRVSEVEM